jgi:large subunit ribosomal protein L20
MPFAATSTRAVSTKHKATLRMAKGYKGRGSKVFSVAIERVEKALQHAYIGRKLKKRNYRRSWITNLNAAARQYDLPYSVFMNKMNASGMLLNRKILADMARSEPFSFKAVVDVVKSKSPAAKA